MQKSSRNFQEESQDAVRTLSASRDMGFVPLGETLSFGLQRQNGAARTRVPVGSRYRPPALLAPPGHFFGCPTTQVRTLAAPSLHRPSLARYGRPSYGSRFRAICLPGFLGNGSRRTSGCDWAAGLCDGAECAISPVRIEGRAHDFNPEPVSELYQAPRARSFLIRNPTPRRNPDASGCRCGHRGMA